MGKNSARKILVLNMGGTANADRTKTVPIIDPEDGQPKTITYPWRDEEGRMPTEIFFDDFHPELGATYEEISDKDSKFVTPEQIARMHARIDAARGEGYDLVIVVSGTDKQVEWGQEIEARNPDVTVTFVGAMKEATHDLNKSGTRFNYVPGKKMKSDFWSRIYNAALHSPRERGAFIEVKGHYEHASNVRKDFKKKEFVAIIARASQAASRMIGALSLNKQ